MYKTVKLYFWQRSKKTKSAEKESANQMIEELKKQLENKISSEVKYLTIILNWCNHYGVDFLPRRSLNLFDDFTCFGVVDWLKWGVIRWGAAAQKLECGSEESERASERNQEPEERPWERDTRCHERYFLFINSSSLKQILTLLTTDDVPILIPDSLYRASSSSDNAERDHRKNHRSNFNTSIPLVNTYTICRSPSFCTQLSSSVIWPWWYGKYLKMH